MKNIYAIILAALFSGCAAQQVPRTRVNIPGLGTLSGPKDVVLRGLKIEAPNHVTVSIEELTARNVPDVISASGAATAQGFKAAQDLFQAGVDAGVRAAASAVK